MRFASPTHGRDCTIHAAAPLSCLFGSSEFPTPVGSLSFVLFSTLVLARSLMADDEAEPGMDPDMMAKLMGAMGGGAGGGGGGMDMAALQAMLGGMGGMNGMDMGGMGGDPETSAKRKAQMNQQDAAAKNAGELDEKTYKWEQTSKYGESEIIVRFPLATPATKKDVKVVFKARELKVSVSGEELLSGRLAGTITIDDSTWCLVEKGSELQLLLALAEDVKWGTLLDV